MINFSLVYELLRFEIADDDDLNEYRFSYKNVMQWFRESIRTLISVRPDLAIGSDFNRISIEPFRFDFSERVDLSGFERVDGWNHIENPTIQCTVAVSPRYVSLTLDSLLRADAVLRPGLAVLRPAPTENPFSGSIQIGRNIRNDVTFDITAVEQPIYISDRYIQSIVHYMAYLSFLKDSEDTGNSSRSSAYLQLFQNEVQGI